MSYYQRGGGSALWLIVFALMALFLFIFVARNPAFKNWLSQFMKGMGPVPQQQQQQPQQQQQQTPPPSSEEGTATGAHVYKTTGNTCSGEDGSQTIGCSGSDVHSERHDFNGCQLTNYEATAIISYTASSCGCGEEFDVKLGGPGHSDGNCCWWLVAVNNEGCNCVTTGGEGPHPETTKDSTEGVLPAGNNLGTVSGKRIGLKGVTWDNGNGTRHFEGWVDMSGSGTNWVKVASQDLAQWGKDETSSTIPNDQQIEFRCDCEGVNWEAADVVEIVPGQLASGGGTTPPTTTPPTTTTPPADDDDEEEEDNGGGGGSTTTGPPPSGGGTPGGSSQFGCPARCAPLRQSSPASYQACCASGVAGLARVYTAKGLLRDRMQAYSAGYDEVIYRKNKPPLRKIRILPKRKADRATYITGHRLRIGNL